MTEVQPSRSSNTSARRRASGSLVAHAREISALAASHAADHDTLGKLHPDVLAELQAAGLPQMLKPPNPRSVREFTQVCGALAEGCMSTGWCNFVWGVHNHLIGLFPTAVQRQVWAEPNTLVSASLGPTGKGTRTGLGVTAVGGQWKFNSGADHADWLLLGFSQPEGEPQLGLFHRSEYELDQTSWDVLGLRGTGSKNASVSNIQLPPERILPFSASIAPYNALLLLVIVAPVIGGAQGTVNEFRSLLGKKRSNVTGRKLQDSDAVTSLRIARDTAYAASVCSRSARLLFEAAGGAALQRTSVIQRGFRDVSAGCNHARLGWDVQALPWAKFIAEDQN